MISDSTIVNIVIADTILFIILMIYFTRFVFKWFLPLITIEGSADKFLLFCVSLFCGMELAKLISLGILKLVLEILIRL